MGLAPRGQVLKRPVAAIKQRCFLDFLDLPESPRPREGDLDAVPHGSRQSQAAP
jgi:hypothetical protein